MMKKILCAIFVLTLLCSCAPADVPDDGRIDATKYGVLPENSGMENSQNLQALIDETSETGGIIYIPAGEYTFAENGTQTIGTHCIKMRSNVSIVGDGEKTVLKPMGVSRYGMDMFYFNDYLDTGEAVYLENCRFEGFVIDASGTSCEVYTSAGKGFMFNLFRNCHWELVTVKYTDATGFGVDCPIDSSIQNCTAIGCGKAATDESGGASGFGIGYGYCVEENMTITGCYAEENKKFGFFFEHQGRFNSEMYRADDAAGFRVSACKAKGNHDNFGGIVAFGGMYENCISLSPVRAGFCFEDCRDFTVKDCLLRQSKDYDIYTIGNVSALVLTGNQSDTNRLSFSDTPADWVNTNNSWNGGEAG